MIVSYIPADKTTNYYSMDKNTYKLIKENVTKTYKKLNEKP